MGCTGCITLARSFADFAEDEDDRKSERSSISLLSVDLEEQRQQLVAMLAAKQKQLAHTRRQAALHAKKQLIHQMKVTFCMRLRLALRAAALNSCLLTCLAVCCAGASC
jgi:hypothetical protein